MTLFANSTVKSFIAARTISGLVSIFVISFLVFLGTAMLPGDAANALLGQHATPQAAAALRKTLGLDQPLLLRYLHWLANALQGDFGTSLSNSQPVFAVLIPRLINSLTLALSAAVIVLPLAIGLGLLAAIKQGKMVDTMTGAASTMLLSMPSFLIGYLLVAIFAVKLNLFPPLSMIRSNAGILTWISAMTLPVLTLMLVAQSSVTKLTRAAILGVMSSPYILMAETKGVPRNTIFIKHALPNALSPIISICMMTGAYLIVDTVVVEAVFNYPGMGKQLVDAVAYRDIPTVQACAVFYSLIFIFLNFTADLLAMLVNPRRRLPATGAAGRVK